MPSLVVYPSDPHLIGAACRLVGLLGQIEAPPELPPLVEHAILFRLLAEPYGAVLRRLAAADSYLHQVNRAITHIRAGFRGPLRVRDIAAAPRMSESSLHEHFKAINPVTPLDCQKRLRLQEARRLMVAEDACAAAAGFAVGYIELLPI